MASSFPYDDEPFNPPAEAVAEAPAPPPWVGDVWRRKVDKDNQRDPRQGVVDVVDVHGAFVWFEPRWGPDRGKPQKLNIPVFVMVYEPRHLAERPT